MQYNFSTYTHIETKTLHLGPMDWVFLPLRLSVFHLNIQPCMQQGVFGYGQGRSQYEARRGNCLVLFSCSKIRLTSILSNIQVATSNWKYNKFRCFSLLKVDRSCHKSPASTDTQFYWMRVWLHPTYLAYTLWHILPNTWQETLQPATAWL